MTNTATATLSGPGVTVTNPANNAGALKVQVVGVDFAITKLAQGKKQWPIGSNQSFGILLQTYGIGYPNSAISGSKYTFVDQIPEGFDYTGFSGPGLTCSPPPLKGPDSPDIASGAPVLPSDQNVAENSG